MVELNREKRGDFDSLSGVAGFLSKVAGSVARLFCQRELGSVLQDPAMRKKENGDWSFKAENREAVICYAGVSPNSPLLSQIWCTLESVPDIWLDIEPDIGWFLLVRIFNNEVSDAERLWGQGRRCRWTKLPLRRISDARLPVSNGNCSPCKDFFKIKLSGQTYFRHHPCSFIRIDRMSVINRNWRFTPIAGSEFRSILRHSHSLPPPTRSSGRARRGHPCAGDVDQSELSKCPRTTGDQVIKHSVYFIRKN